MLLIFDWDGTLADSELHIVTALRAAAEELGWQLQSHRDCASVIGLGLREAACTLYAGLSEPDIDHYCRSYRDHFRNLANTTQPLRLFEQAEATLFELQRRGHALAVATGKSRQGLDRALQECGLAELFCATRTADESQSKPHPAMLRDILSSTTTAVDGAAMIGDTSFDMQMASALGMPRVAANYGVHSAADLEQFDPVWSIDRIDQLLDWPGLA
ncbi:MAG: HAD hydrolase-like protein [Pseudomonadales bacterium]|nr:HAD hydrolase-like protein [Pseudomonadales bacterium]